MRFCLLTTVLALLASQIHGWSYLFGSRSSEKPAAQQQPTPPVAGTNTAGSQLPTRGSSRGSLIPSNPQNQMGRPPGAGSGQPVSASKPIPVQQGRSSGGQIGMLGRSSSGHISRSGSVQRFSMDPTYSGERTSSYQPMSHGGPASSPYYTNDVPIEMRLRKPFRLEYTSVDDILSQPYYFVDKSAFIAHWLEDTAGVNVFLRPRRTGKSVAASMLASFLDNKKEASQGGFKSLAAIYTDPKYAPLVEKHGGKYHVLRFDWASSGVMQASDQVDFETRLLLYIQRWFRDMMSMTGAKPADLQNWAPEGVTLEHLIEAETLESLAPCLGTVAHILGNIAECQVVVIVDNYDEVYRKAAEMKAYEATNDFLVEFFEGCRKYGDGFVWRIVAFGVHHLVNDGPFAKCSLKNRDTQHQFFVTKEPERVTYSFPGKNDRYQTDFGFTEDEVNEAMKHFPSLLVDIGKLEAWYQIMTENTGRTVLLHPYSTASAIRYGALDAYWTREGPLCMSSWALGKMTREGKKHRLGPGDLLAVALDPHNAEFKWPGWEGPKPVSYDPEDKTEWTMEHFLSWLWAEGYVTKGQHSSLEMTEHLKRFAFTWASQDSNLVQFISTFKQHYKEALLLEPIKTFLFTSSFKGGIPALADRQGASRFLVQMIASICPLQDRYQYEAEQFPVLELSSTDWLILVVDLTAKAFPEQHMISRLKMSRLVRDLQHKFYLLTIGYNNETRQPVLSFTLAFEP